MTADKPQIHSGLIRLARQKIHWLDRAEQVPAARADLAILRRGLGKNPGEIPEILAITLPAKDAEYHPSDLLLASGDGPPTPVEWAMHVALTLYALHRQGQPGSMTDNGEQPSDGKRRPGASFGAAMRRLRMDSQKEPGVARRFNAMITASDIREFARHAMGAVQMLRAADIRMDYAAFAADLLLFQIPTRREGIKMKWGRDFWREESKDKPTVGGTGAAQSAGENQHDEP